MITGNAVTYSRGTETIVPALSGPRDNDITLFLES